MTAYTQLCEKMRAEPSTWLVTGVAGFIGSNLLEHLLKMGQTVVGLDNFLTGYQKNLDMVEALVGPEAWSRFTFIEGDIRDLDTCRKACEGVDHVLHEAALGSVPRSIDDPILSNSCNITGYLNMLVAARDAGVKSFVYAASSSTYGDSPELPKVEDKIGNPLSPYAVTKYVDELYADVFARCYGFTTVGLRYFNVFGQRQDPYGAYAAVIPQWFASLLKKETVFVKKCVNRLSIGLYHCALAGAEGVFFQNRDDAELFRKVGILRRSARVLMARGTGVDIRRFAEAPLPPLPAEGCAPEEREIIFLLVGRLLEAKGLPEYAAAAKELKTQYPAARFQLLGPPEQGLGSVDLAQVRRWQDEGSIEYLGETRDVRPYVEACHALVLPSWREGTPTSIMEGMSMGRAAVVTDVPGCREVVEDGVNGCICAAHDPRALAAAMRRLLDEPGLLVRMGAAGRDLACREFDAEVVAEKILVDMRVPRAAG